jgi:hypothetical protein
MRTLIEKFAASRLDRRNRRAEQVQAVYEDRRRRSKSGGARIHLQYV